MTPNPPASATIRDVARQCGLSISTVSHVLNHHTGRYSAETADKVWVAVHELGYVPNHIGRMLRKGNDWLLGALVPNLENVFYADMIRALDLSAQRRARLLLTVSLGDDFGLQEQTIRSLRGAMLSGLVVIGTTPRELHHVMTLAHPETPLVFVNRGSEGFYAGHYGIGIDNYEAGRALGAYLRHHGCQRVAILRGPDYSYASRQRYEGFVAGATGTSRDVTIVYDEPVMLTAAAGFERAATVCQLHPDGIFCGNDMVALGVAQYCMVAGLHVPQDILITGFDYNSLTRIVGRRLVTIEQPVDQMAQRIVAWLSDYARGSHTPVCERVEFRLVVPSSASSQGSPTPSHDK